MVQQVTQITTTAFKVTLVKSQERRLAPLPSFHGGWSTGTYFSNTFCSCYQFFFWKSHPLWLDEASQNSLLCEIIWPANQSVVLLKRKQACGCCSQLQAATELRNRINDMVAFPCQNNNKITKCNSKYCSTYAYGANPYTECKFYFYETTWE